MKNSQEITVNGVTFTPEMLETMQRWYEPLENAPKEFIDDLMEMQGYFIDELDQSLEEDKNKMIDYLQKTRWLITNLKPFVKGGME